VDDISTRLAANLKTLREAGQLSQKALAEQSGVPRPTIAHLESGQANPTLSVVLKVARALGIAVDDLVDPGEAPIRVLSPKTLPTERTPRLRRVRLAPAGGNRDGGAERIVFKLGGRIKLEPHAGAEVLVCEKGDFELVSGPLVVSLQPEQVALVRAATDCVARSPGILYRLS
jgi:transcriptional regulator with XRE-family HTH domain